MTFASTVASNTIRNTATITNFGSISNPLIFVSLEKPIMPADAMGMDTLSCFIRLNEMRMI